MKKVLIVTPIFPPEGRGPATYCHSLCQKIPSIVITFTKNPVSVEGVKVYSIPIDGGGALRQIHLAKKIWEESRNCDVIYAQGADVVGLASVVVGKIVGRPVVIKFVGDLSVEMERDFNRKIWYLFYATKLTLGLADKVVFPAKHLRDQIVDKYKITADKTEVIYNAV